MNTFRSSARRSSHLVDLSRDMLHGEMDDAPGLRQRAIVSPWSRQYCRAFPASRNRHFRPMIRVGQTTPALSLPSSSVTRMSPRASSFRDGPAYRWRSSDIPYSEQMVGVH